MTNKVSMLEQVLKYHTFSNNRLILKVAQKHKGLNNNEFMKFLKDLSIDNRTMRMSTIWTIEEIIEENILKNIHKSDEILITEDAYKESKSKFNKLINNEDTFKFIMRHRGYKNINDMRAFAAICEGDIEVYKAYSRNSDNILSYAILRVLAIANEYNDSKGQEKTNEILQLTKNILTSIYGIKDAYSLNVETVMRNNFKEKDYLLEEYKKVATKGEVLFASGVFKILKEYFEKEQNLQAYEVIKENFEKAFLETSLEEKEDVDACENKESSLSEDCISISEEDKKDDLDDILEVVEINIDEIGIETKEEIVLNEDEIAKEIKTRLEEIESFVVQMKTHKKKENENEQEKLDFIKDLKDENTRLKNEIEVLRRRVSEVSLKDFIQRIGGRECGYQLSELYMLSEGIMEDDENIQGRLINLFGILEGYFLESYLGKYNINDEFEIDRKTLSQNYILEMPLRGDDEVVKVRLIKNGWKYNSEVIVPPLVRQLF